MQTLPTEVEMLEASTDSPEALGVAVSSSVRRVERWQLVATPAPGDPPYPAEGPFEALLDRAARDREIRVHRSASLRCAAEEIGRLVVGEVASPPPRFVRAVANACGTSLDGIRVSATPGTVGATLPLADLVRQASASMYETLAATLRDGELVGLSFARSGDDAVLVLAHGSPRVQLEAPEPPDAEGWVRVRGRVLFTQLEEVTGYVNQGATGVARCVASEQELPDFELRCPMAPDDTTALLEIRGASPSQGASRLAGTLMLQRSPSARAPVVFPPLGERAPVTDSASGARAALERVNALRRSSGLDPLSLAPGQGELNARVAPSLLLSSHRQDLERSELLGRGVFAGRRVTAGDIRRGYILAGLAQGTRDVSRWLSEALETPNGRRVLLNPDVAQLAVGAVPVPERNALAMVVSTYAFFDDSQHEVEADALYARIVAARTADGSTPPARLRELPGVLGHVDGVCSGTETVSDAAEAMRHALRRSGQTVDVVECADLERFALPDEALTRAEVGVVVAHTRAPGAAWGQYAVFFVYR